MKKNILVIFCFLLVLTLTGCASLDALLQPTASVDNNAGAQPLPPYSGPKARIAVADFDVKAAKAGGEIGSGLREMLVTALINSNRFSVVERQALAAVMQEQELSSSGAAQTTDKGYALGCVFGVLPLPPLRRQASSRITGYPVEQHRR